jgi:hypothetical protein
MAAVIDLLGAIPLVRYIMGLVDARWRPLWAVLWLAVIPAILFLTVRLTLRRARHRVLQEQATRERPGVASARSIEHGRAVPEPEERSRVLKPASTPPRSPVEMAPAAPSPERGVPVPVIVGAVVAGLVAVAVTALFLPNKPAAPAKPAASVDSSAPADTGLDVRWRSGRMERADCIGTFEVTRGGGTPAQFVAFVMDTTGAIIARDSGSVDSAMPGVLIDFRFRRVACERVYDWQLQVKTPKARTP